MSGVFVNRSALSVPIGWLIATTIVAFPLAVAAQTDYYNTDSGRPITVEDAYATERYAFELQLAPLRLERSNGGLYTWEVEPEIAYGIFPRTHIEMGVPIAYQDRGPAGKTLGAAGLDISLLHNLNAETSIPALGVAGELLLPFGGLAPDNAYFSAKGIVTRTFTWARFHLNARYTFGESPAILPLGEEGDGGEISRWLLGLAIDKASPLRSMLLTAETFVSEPIQEGEAQWNVGAGVRYQASPRLALDGGVGKRLTGDDQGWFLTFGMARAFAIRSLLPGAGRARTY